VYLAVLSNTVIAQHQISGKEIKTTIWNNQQVEYVDREIAVKLKKGFSALHIQSTLSQYQASIKQNFDELGWGWIELPAGTDIFPVIDSLKKLPMIDVVEPNLVTRIQIEPNDPYFKGTSPATYRHQWGLHNIGQSPPGGTNDADIDAPEAWDISTGSSNVILAILDTGIPMLSGVLSHPDLDDPNKMMLGPDYIDAPGTPEYNEGVRDRNGHGTHVAGIAGTETNNGTGIAGVAWNCKLMIIQVFDQNGSGTWQAFYNGVKYAVDYYRNNPSTRIVINYSGGGGASQTALDAVIYANTYGVTLVAAAGNHNSSIIYPAAYSTSYSNVLVIGATQYNDVRSSYSNYGPQLNVVAPGGAHDGGYPVDAGDIFSTMPNYTVTLNGSPYLVTQNYGYLPGTSMAAPHVAGVTALLLSSNPSLTPSQIRNILQLSADDKGTSGFDNYYGYGRINANKAVCNLYVPQVYSTISSAISAAVSGQTVVVSGGTYSENLAMKAGVSVVGAGPGSTTINGTVTFDNDSYTSLSSVTVNGKITILSNSTGVTLSEIAAGSSNCYLDVTGQSAYVNNFNSNYSQSYSVWVNNA
jgi:serine protease